MSRHSKRFLKEIREPSTPEARAAKAAALSYHNMLGEEKNSDVENFLTSISLKHFLEQKNNVTVKPDTFLCKRFFLEGFITSEMHFDFPLIARDFLENELPNISKYETLQYLEIDESADWGYQVFNKGIMNLMMNALVAGSDYTKKLFIYLYKTYYRKEYQQIKRFKKIGTKDIGFLVQDDMDLNLPYALSRVLVMPEILGIEIDQDCDVFYEFFNHFDEIKRLAAGKKKERAKEDEKKEDEHTIKEEITELSDECLDQIDEWFKNEEDAFRAHRQNEKYIANMFSGVELAPDYHTQSAISLSDEGARRSLATTLALLKKTFKDREFTKEEVVAYEGAFTLGITLTMILREDVKKNRKLLEENYEYSCDSRNNVPGRRLFNAEDIKKSTQNPDNVKETKAENKPVLKKPEEKPACYKESDLLAEIEALRRKNHMCESEIKALKAELSDTRKIAGELDKLKLQLEQEHKEVVALRNHVFYMSEHENDTGCDDIEEKKAFLNQLKVVVIGGAINWQKKMKKELDSWIYIDPSVRSSLDPQMINYADYVYIFSDHIGHSTFYKYMSVIKTHDINFGYISSVNIENAIQQAYDELSEKFGYIEGMKKSEKQKKIS